MGVQTEEENVPDMKEEKEVEKEKKHHHHHHRHHRHKSKSRDRTASKEDGPTPDSQKKHHHHHHHHHHRHSIASPDSLKDDKKHSSKHSHEGSKENKVELAVSPSLGTSASKVAKEHRRNSLNVSSLNGSQTSIHSQREHSRSAESSPVMVGSRLIANNSDSIRAARKTRLDEPEVREIGSSVPVVYNNEPNGTIIEDVKVKFVEESTIVVEHSYDNTEPILVERIIHPPIVVSTTIIEPPAILTPIPEDIVVTEPNNVILERRTTVTSETSTRSFDIGNPGKIPSAHDSSNFMKDKRFSSIIEVSHILYI